MSCYTVNMKQEQFKKIIKLLQPQMTEVKFGKKSYRAYLYVIRFYFKEQEYILRMYMLDNTAEVLKIYTHFNRYGTKIEEWEHIISEDEVSEEIRKQIEEIQGE